MKLFGTSGLSSQSQRRLGFSISALLVVVTLIIHGISAPDTAMSSPSPLPERHKTEEEIRNPDWVSAQEGSTRTFGPVTILLPAGFTEQGGATVIGNPVVVPVGIENKSELLAGTLFALGIWPPNNQTKYQESIQLTIALNSAQIPPNTNNRYVIVQYVPAEAKWVHLPTDFSRATYVATASTDEMTPVAPDFPDWGGRTFFAVAKSSTAEGATDQGSEVRRLANIRSGPGIVYSVLRVAKAGEKVDPLYKSEDGKWLMLADDTWIAAFLVKNVPADLPVYKLPVDEAPSSQ